MCTGDTPDYAGQQREAEAKRQATIQQGTQKVNDTFSQFDDKYFDTRQKDYTDFYSPQLDQQYKKASDSLINSLGGNINGSEGAKSIGELTKQYEMQKAKLAQDAINYGQDARLNLNNQRSQLISQLEGGGSIENAGALAQNYAASIARPSSFSPLANLFASSAAQTANAVNAGSNGYAPVDFGIFNSTGVKNAQKNY